MAKKTIKDYKVVIADGKMTLTMNKKVDGKQISACCIYPNYQMVDGIMKRQSKAQTEKMLLQNLGYNA